MALSGQLRIRVLERDGYRCVYCGRSSLSVELEVDHVLPKARGGSDDATNLATACRDCNGGKSAGLISIPDHVVLAPLPPIPAPRVPIHRQGWEFEAQIRWPESSDMVSMKLRGRRHPSTRFAVVSWCSFLMVSLYQTAMAAGNAMSRLVPGCEHGCRGDHQLVDMAVPEMIDPGRERLRGARRAAHMRDCYECTYTFFGYGPAAALARAADRARASVWP